MRPLLGPGQRVLVDTSVAHNDLRPGDILAVEPRAGRLLLHRLVKRRKNGELFTQGDNCTRREGPLRPEQIIGRLTGIEDGANEGQWRPQRALPAWILAMAAPLRPRRLVRVFQILLSPLSFGTPFRAVVDDPRRPLEVALASGDDSDDFECQELGNELLIHDKRSGDVHVLNSMAYTIFDWVKEGLGQEAIVDKIASAYPDEDRADIQKSVEEVLETIKTLDVSQ